MKLNLKHTDKGRYINAKEHVLWLREPEEKKSKHNNKKRNKKRRN